MPTILIVDDEADVRETVEMILDYEDQDPANALVTTLAQEREMNTFFRLQSPSVIAKLVEEGVYPSPLS